MNPTLAAALAGAIPSTIIAIVAYLTLRQNTASAKATQALDQSKVALDTERVEQEEFDRITRELRADLNRLRDDLTTERAAREAAETRAAKAENRAASAERRAEQLERRVAQLEHHTDEGSTT